jgi:hypothetical protein
VISDWFFVFGFAILKQDESKVESQKLKEGQNNG